MIVSATSVLQISESRIDSRHHFELQIVRPTPWRVIAAHLLKSPSRNVDVLEAEALEEKAGDGQAELRGRVAAVLTEIRHQTQAARCQMSDARCEMSRNPQLVQDLTIQQARPCLRNRSGLQARAQHGRANRSQRKGLLLCQMPAQSQTSQAQQEVAGYLNAVTSAELTLLQKLHNGHSLQLGEFCAGMATGTLVSSVLETCLQQQGLDLHLSVNLMSEMIEWKREVCTDMHRNVMRGQSPQLELVSRTANLAAQRPVKTCNIAAAAIECDDVSSCSTTPRSILDRGGIRQQLPGIHRLGYSRSPSSFYTDGTRVWLGAASSFSWWGRR